MFFFLFFQKVTSLSPVEFIILHDFLFPLQRRAPRENMLTVTLPVFTRSDPRRKDFWKCIRARTTLGVILKKLLQLKIYFELDIACLIPFKTKEKGKLLLLIPAKVSLLIPNFTIHLSWPYWCTWGFPSSFYSTTTIIISDLWLKI